MCVLKSVLKCGVQGVLQCVAVCCSVMQCVAMFFCALSVLQKSDLSNGRRNLCIKVCIEVCVAVCCSVLQCVAVRYSVLQRSDMANGYRNVCIAVCVEVCVARCVAVCCNTL